VRDSQDIYALFRENMDALTGEEGKKGQINTPFECNYECK
jgi:hypothetical protein